MSTTERELLDQALTALLCALAHDEATICGAGPADLAKLRDYWVPDAEAVIDQAEELGYFNYDGEDIDHE